MGASLRVVTAGKGWPACVSAPSPKPAGIMAEGRGSRGPVEAGLLDLPDELLRMVAQRMTTIEGEFMGDMLLPWLLTCRRLAVVGYSSVESLLIIRRPEHRLEECHAPSSVGELMASEDGQRMARRLPSLCAFLGHARYVREAFLQEVDH